MESDEYDEDGEGDTGNAADENNAAGDGDESMETQKKPLLQFMLFFVYACTHEWMCASIHVIMLS